MAATSRRLLHSAVLLSLFLASAGTLAATDPKAARYYEDALSRYGKRDIAGAIVQLKNALQIDSSMLPVHVLLGKALLANNEAGAAEAEFTEALRLGVDRAEVVVPLGRALIQQGKHRQLLEQPLFAPAGLPSEMRANLLLLRASAYSDLGDARSALRSLEEARAAEPAVPDSWMTEVNLRIRAGQYAEAAQAADKAIQLAPKLAQAQYLRGSVAHVTGDLLLALSHYDKALMLQPTHTEALVTRAGLLIDLRRFGDARRDVKQLGASDPNDPRGAFLESVLDEQDGNVAASRAALNKVTTLLDPVPIEALRFRPQVLMLGGLAHFSLGQGEKAKPYLEAVQRAQPGSPVSKLLARIYLADKNLDRAVEALEAYLKQQPGDTQALLLLGSAQLAQGRHARAASLMQDALKTNDDPSIRSLLGVSLIGGREFADAAKELEAALAKDPRQLQAGVALTTLYIQSGITSRGIAVATKLAKAFPDNAGVQNLLGMALMRAGNDAAARAPLQKALKIDPKFAAANVNLARLDRRAKAYDAAISRLNAVLESDDKDIAALTELGQLHEQRGQTADAQRYMLKAADSAGPTDLGPATALVDFFLRLGRADLAREAVGRLTSRAPDSPSVLITQARVALAASDVDEAARVLTRAAQMGGYNVPLLLQIATLQVQAGAIPGAGYTLAKVLGERPDFPPAEALMAEVELRQGNIAAAEARARSLVARHPRLPGGYAMLGDAEMARNRPAAAAEHYRKAHQIEQTGTTLLRAYQALSAADTKAAAQLAEQWLKAHPNDVAVRLALADANARSGNLAAARGGYETVLKSDPGNAEVMNNLANVMLLANDPGAQKVAEQALKLKPGAAHILGTAGWAAWKAGESDRALQMLRDARLRNPGNPDTRYFLAVVLAGTGRKSEAREELEAALRHGPNFASAAEAQRLLTTLK